MAIDKIGLDKALRKVRELYKRHARDEIGPSTFVSQARKELNELYFDHTIRLIKATVDRFTEEAKSFQGQFGVDLGFDEVYLSQRTRGYNGLRASFTIRSNAFEYDSGAVEIFIGPFDEWNMVAVHTHEERKEYLFGSAPSLYSKRRKMSWRKVEDFDFPALLQEIKERSEIVAPDDDEDDIAF